MDRKTMISDLFSPRPSKWGLRGDPFLWDLLCEDAANNPLEPTFERCLAVIDHHFERRVGVSIHLSRNEVYLDGLAHGGMSSGTICPDFWTRRAPLHWRTGYTKLR